MSPPVIDALQYADWSEAVFRQMQAGGVIAVHATVAYHETFRETVAELSAWDQRFRAHPDLIVRAGSARDIAQAQAEGRTAVLFGAQNPCVIEGDLALLEILHRLGLRFLQVAYNEQSLLGTGWREAVDGGVTAYGRAAIAEMNRLGVVVDLSHSGERTALEAIEASSRPTAATHANPRWFRETARNVPDSVIGALAASGGMLGFSLYPHHLSDGPETRLDAFAVMVARVAERWGADFLGIGSDLCQGRGPEALAWMRNGRWRRPAGSGSEEPFPPQPEWFRTNGDFPRVADGLAAVGFEPAEVAAIMGGNWMRFFEQAFPPARETDA